MMGLDLLLPLTLPYLGSGRLVNQTQNFSEFFLLFGWQVVNKKRKTYWLVSDAN